MAVEFSERQEAYFALSTAFINLAEGAVRSGKTFVTLYRFIEHALLAPSGDMMILGKTERTVKRNVVGPLKAIAKREKSLSVRYVQGAGELFIGERLVYIVGANDVSAQDKVQGATLAGSYCNELTLYPEGVWQTLIDRHSIPGAKMFADCNPDSPYHWLYKNYMHGEILEPSDMLTMHFILEDNPQLEEEYKARLHRLHPPGTLWHRRMVLGEWVLAEGAIYDMFDPKVHVVDQLPKSFERYVVGVDYGTVNPCVYLLLGKHRNAWYVLSEYRHDSTGSGAQKTDPEYAQDMIMWLLANKAVPTSIEVDPSAASFKLQLRRDGVRKVVDAVNDVDDGIRTTASALSAGGLFIHSSCTELIKELSNYRWDEAASDRGHEKPLKIADHGPDALRYAVMRIFSKTPQLALRLVR